ncbi:MAG: ABC transporter permease [Eubacterium sp.]|jgi:ABC-type antimicrobial peptide transport system permease subunit|nr:ABC transporter permease [Eubacterium sp.]
MKFSDILSMVFRNLTKRKLRTILTVSGVFIGTMAIVVMISLGIGMSEAQDKIIEEWADLTLISVYNYGDMPQQEGAGEAPPSLTDEVIKELGKIEGVKAITPWYEQIYSGSQLTIYSDEYTFNAPLIGVDMTQLDAFGYKLTEGEWVTDGNFAGVVYVGGMVGSEVFNYLDEEYEWAETEERSTFSVDPMSDELHILPMVIDTDTWELDYSTIGSKTAPNSEYDMELNVKGVIEGNWRDYYTQYGFFIDVSNLKNLIDGFNDINSDQKMEEFTGVYDSVRIRAEDMKIVAEIEEKIQEMGYQTYSDGQSRENMKKQTQLIQMMLGALAAVSLFVAALNITNTMIMAIVERTKEIGIMKVLGCDIPKIRLLFLCEAASIGFIGGIVGVVFSFIVSALMNGFLAETLMKMLAGEYFTMPEGVKISQIPVWLAAAALGFATLVGVAAGLQPANRSVKISALSAISHD